MWTRSLLKTNAKAALAGRYWRTLGVCLVAALLGAPSLLRNSFFVVQEWNERYSEYTAGEVWTGNAATPELSAELYDALVVSGLLGVVILAAVLGLLIGLCVQFLLGAPLEVGRCRYMMESRQGQSPFGTLFSVFHAPYWNLVKVRLLVELKIFLGCLVIVPGILWSYEYCMVPYLLAENPYLSAARAMELSKQMMDGEKWNTFVLGLSFLGWSLLCALTLGIGFLFLEPYHKATFAELYAALRSKAFALNLTDSRELAGFLRYEGSRPL